MGKILALDLGDAWTGVAVTDKDRLFARPYKTVATKDLTSFLTETLAQEAIRTIIIGHPRTMKGGESDQTRKVVAQKEHLEEAFPQKEFILWDERLSSQRAQTLGSRKKNEDKNVEHARAAAFILDSYITFLRALASNNAQEIDKLG